MRQNPTIFIKSFLSLFLVFFCFNLFLAQQQWSNFVDSVSTLSSPRTADLNNDNIKDIVIGSGTDSTFSNYGILAFDGSNGTLLWNLPTTDEIFTSAIFNDINNDSIPDIFMGGRNAQFYAIDGASGNIIWEYFPQNIGLNPADSGLYNFYSAQFLDDQNGDNIKDILVANGGDHKASPFDSRPPGQLMIIDGLNGSLIASAVTPDSAETYSSPVVYDRAGAIGLSIVFGTGGESHGGSVYVATLSDLMNNDISNSIVLATDLNKGFIAPASIADLTSDGFLDIVIQSFNGEIQAFDGLNYQSLWSKSFIGCESSSAPTIGNFTGGDLVPDIFNVVYKGTTPSYFEYYQFVIDGSSGEVVFLDSIGDMHFSSSTAFDSNGDGRDEVLFSVNYINSYFTHQLKMLDFQNDTLHDVTNSVGGVNLGCTPLIDDLDNDGKIEFIYTSKSDSLSPSAWKGFNIFRYNTNYNYPNRGLAWGAYMGTSFDGHYTNLLHTCSNSNMILSWEVNNPSCNLLSDGNIIPDSILNYPSTFLWSDGSVLDSLINSPSGVYSVYLSDSNNCLETHHIQLNDPFTISFGNIVHNNCVGDSSGSVTVASTGCVCQFSTCTFIWSNGSLIKDAVNLTAGYHVIEITHDNGCVVVDSIFINDGTPVIDSFYVDNISCYNINDGSISLFPNDSMTNYYWDDGTVGSLNDSLSSGNYLVLADNFYCRDSMLFNINPPDTVTFVSSITNVDCFGASSGSIELIPSGGFPPYNFSINGSNSTNSILNNLPIGVYQAYILDSNNCSSDSVDLFLTQPYPLQLSFDVTPATDSFTFNGVVNASVIGGTLPYTFNWSHLPGISDSTVVFLNYGYYDLEVLDGNGCQISDSVYVGFITSLNEEIPFSIKVYPVPSVGEVSIFNDNNENTEAHITDISGKLVNKLFINSFETKSITLSPGQYFINFYSKNILLTKPIIIVSD